MDGGRTHASPRSIPLDRDEQPVTAGRASVCGRGRGGRERDRGREREWGGGGEGEQAGRERELGGGGALASIARASKASLNLLLPVTLDLEFITLHRRAKRLSAFGKMCFKEKFKP